MKNTSNDALYFTEDILTRSFVQFMLLGETAKTVVEGFGADLEGPIELGVLKKDLTKSGLSTLKMLLPRDSKITDNLISFDYGGVPVNIKIIHRNYSFFKNPDFIFHKLADFCVPNPFKKYWKTRNLIQ